MWTTRRLRELERATVEIAERRAGEEAAPVEERSLKQARREIGREIRASLSAEQREALETITGPGGVSVLVGRAGTGKGVVISAAARAWQLEGYEVIGTAVAGATAQRLQEDAGLDRSYTADGLINGVEKEPHRPRASAASWSWTRRGWPTPSASPGSPSSPPSPAASSCSPATRRSSARSAPAGLFKALEGRVPTAELTEVHRAHHEWERRAWEQSPGGRTRSGARAVPRPRPPPRPRHPRRGRRGDGRGLGRGEAKDRPAAGR